MALRQPEAGEGLARLDGEQACKSEGFALLEGHRLLIDVRFHDGILAGDEFGDQGCFGLELQVESATSAIHGNDVDQKANEETVVEKPPLSRVEVVDAQVVADADQGGLFAVSNHAGGGQDLVV